MKPLYAIKHKPTGFYLPEPTGRQGRGSSHTEPTDPKEARPNLFPSELSARRCLIQWLRGKHTAYMNSEYDDMGGHLFYYQDGTEVQPQTHRKAEDMEIVEIQLLDVGPVRKP